MVAALGKAALNHRLARCPASSAGSTNWYALTGKQVNPGYLAVQVKCKGKPCEGFVLSRGEKLPPLQPNQLALFSEQCDAGSERKVVLTSKPPELIAGAIKTLLPPAAGPASYDWKVLVALPSGIAWNGDGPKPGNMSYKGDPGPWLQTGQVTLGGREFSVAASGTTAHVTAIYFDEMGTHPKGEHMLGALYDKGLTVTLVRCGPVYTESTNNWYSATSSATRPVMILQSIRYDGNLVQDSYALRLDGTLPARDPRDRNPGAVGVDDWTFGCWRATDLQSQHGPICQFGCILGQRPDNLLLPVPDGRFQPMRVQPLLLPLFALSFGFTLAACAGADDLPRVTSHLECETGGGQTSRCTLTLTEPAGFRITLTTGQLRRPQHRDPAREPDHRASHDRCMSGSGGHRLGLLHPDQPGRHRNQHRN